MTPSENAAVAYAILDQANADLEGGRPTEFVALDIARAQVYATLAAVPAPPTQVALSNAIRAALDARGVELTYDTADVVAEAVGRLL